MQSSIHLGGEGNPLDGTSQRNRRPVGQDRGLTLTGVDALDASHVLPKCAFWEATRFERSYKVLILLVP
jgi:hypothetical protein